MRFPGEPRDDPRDERAEALHEMLSSPGWQSVAAPALKARLESVKRQLAGARHAGIEEIRWLQAQAVLLNEMIVDARAFLSAEAE